jgi:hypothetical protein
MFNYPIGIPALYLVRFGLSSMVGSGPEWTTYSAFLANFTKMGLSNENSHENALPSVLIYKFLCCGSRHERG